MRTITVSLAFALACSTAIAQNAVESRFLTRGPTDSWSPPANFVPKAMMRPRTAREKMIQANRDKQNAALKKKENAAKAIQAKADARKDKKSTVRMPLPKQ